MNRKLSLAALVFGLAVVASTQVQAQAPSWSAGGAQEASAKPFAPSGVHPSFINAQAPAGSAICYTCGNDWPVYEGTIPTAAAANEFGSGCSGGLSTANNDHYPYLCSR